MKQVRPLHDWVYVELEEAPQPGLIASPNPEPVRTAKVLSVGPGRSTKKTCVRSEVRPGDRIAFLMATLETGQGRSIVNQLEKGFGLIRESDILGVLTSDVQITV